MVCCRSQPCLEDFFFLSFHQVDRHAKELLTLLSKGTSSGSTGVLDSRLLLEGLSLACKCLAFVPASLGISAEPMEEEP